VIVSVAVVGVGALVILYFFMERLERKTVRLEFNEEPAVVDTSDNWRVEDLPERWPEFFNDSLAALGEELFATRGCRVCHTVGGGDLVGPDLANLRKRATYRWSLLMLLKPDSMQQYDSTARRLLKEYGVQMPNQKLTPQEAEAILHYVLKGGRNQNSNSSGR